tara:strand:+ start:63 stop:269 length:207 start_codon:yes stop_codon:yes gene_type:complete
MTGGNVTELTPEKMKQRADALKILMAQFGSWPHLVYACAEEWCSKQVTNNGLVGYYKAYYSQKQNDYD